SDVVVVPEFSSPSIHEAAVDISRRPRRCPRTARSPPGTGEGRGTDSDSWSAVRAWVWRGRPKGAYKAQVAGSSPAPPAIHRLPRRPAPSELPGDPARGPFPSSGAACPPFPNGALDTARDCANGGRMLPDDEPGLICTLCSKPVHPGTAAARAGETVVHVPCLPRATGLPA